MRQKPRARFGEPVSPADSTMRKLPRGAAAAPLSGQFGADLLAQPVDQDKLAAPLKMPERPAVPGRCTLHLGGDGVDRAAVLGGDQAAIGAHPRVEAPVP